MLKFTELNRTFAPFKDGEVPSIDAGRLWGARLFGWETWNELLKRPRVVVLAEAGSGKTREFEGCVARLNAQGTPGFFMAIEVLADNDAKACLSPTDVARFDIWAAGDMVAYFLLDSVDEARLNGKKLSVALRKLAHALGNHLQRAHIVVSCRPSDWKGESDIAVFKEQLPYRMPSEESNDEQDPHAKLLGPIFGRDTNNEVAQKEPKDTPLGDVHVVLLTPLSTQQRQTFSAALGVSDVPAFEQAVRSNALENFVHHPRDVILFASYWIKHKRFGSLKDMTENTVMERLVELDKDRSDNDQLTLDQARRGVERLAAGLTLAKSFTIAVGRDGPGDTQATSSVNPAEILSEWTDAQIGALLRRGIFAPATYGRLRFYHRGAQEYLTAMWLDRMIREGSRRVAVENLIFVSIYGVDTLVSSLAPAAAWLSLAHSGVRDKLIQRDPPVLLRHGDPRSLPLSVKESLLESFAKLHAQGDVANDSLDHTMLRMFADPALAPAIRRAWATNEREDFRMDLLRIIREGSIGATADLAIAAVIDGRCNDYMRIVAAQCLKACQDAAGLQALLELSTGSVSLSAQLAPQLAVSLFPKLMDVAQLFALIRRTPQGDRSIEGFGEVIEELWTNCATDEGRMSFLQELTKLCFEEPHFADWRPISKRHMSLANSVEKIAADAVARFGQRAAPELVALLMIVERAERSGAADEGDKPTLFSRIAALPDLKRALFWADVAFERARDKSGQTINGLWQVGIHGQRLWSFEKSDESWLRQDLVAKPLTEDRQIALSALAALAVQDGDAQSGFVKLGKIIRDDPILTADLRAYMRSPEKGEDELEYEKKKAARETEQLRQEKKDKDSWVRFAHELNRDTSTLTDAARLAVWPGPCHILELHQWLSSRVRKQQIRHSATQWHLLEEGFGAGVANAFRQGMRTMWRVTPPERPDRGPNGSSTRKHTTALACEALMLEAADNPQWFEGLSVEEATKGIQHICWSNENVEELLDALIVDHTAIVAPVVVSSLEHEWFAEHEYGGPLLRHVSHSKSARPPWMIETLIRLISGAAPKHIARIDDAIRCIERSETTAEQKRAITKIAVNAFETPLSNRVLSSSASIRLLFQSDAELAGETLNRIMADAAISGASVEGMTLMVELFGDGYNPTACGKALSAVSVPTLVEMIRLAYKLVPPDGDRKAGGVYTPTLHDDAVGARGKILNALLSASGIETYRATLRLATDQTFLGNHMRFLELARSKAEQDAEIGAWTPAQVIAFEKSGLSPATTGEEFFRLCRSVFDEIEMDLRSADASSAPLLQQARDEDQVQLWLAEQLVLRSSGRYHVAREPIVADKKEPDITLLSTTCAYQVAIELKHGGKAWSGRQLRDALRNQLSGQYLKPASRQQGFLVITNHKVDKRWERPDAGDKVLFPDLIDWLRVDAKTLGDVGHIVDVVGLDLTL
ncbi:MAG: hypothetical protein ACRDBL_11005 [Rhabdaerophilum sp.]